ncbi:hypothetical protein AXF42_Ash002570 [Apostasia shenzhenica]|uniref:DUF4408 domain-containing protein n=1 Tax=Apostasia shenzhenica TaxID=1088818 RepID=A0A2I0AP65_9ASPA|nr:hypothetical protein AXF42_Ash002570 [Apostasia shenzhenica]
MDESWPPIWTLIRSWLSPAVLFLLLNLVIGTIALTSKGLLRRRADDAAAPGSDGHAVACTASSALTRLRSLSIYRLRSGDFFSESAPADPPALLSPKSDETAEFSPDLKAFLEKDQEHRFDRSQSEARTPTEVKSPATMAKSASERSPISRVKEMKAVELAEVESPARIAKPASERSPISRVKEMKAVRQPAAPPAKAVELEPGVDARADDFINRFRQQLHLQRLDSLLRFKEMIDRGK